MNDLVSIIMPSYNTEAYIASSIKSVLAQTYTHWELLIVDDGSTDKTLDTIYGFVDSRIRVLLNEKNSGAAISRNRALREAKGRWIAFLDSDDIWHPTKVERQLAWMNENGYSFSYTDYRTKLNDVWLRYVNTGPRIVTRRKMYNYCYFSTITVMYDSERIGLVQIEDLRRNNDYAMWLQAIKKSSCFRLPECLSFYIKHDGSVSSGSKVKLIKWHYKLFRIGDKRGRVLSAILTANNLVHGIVKKIKYRREITDSIVKLSIEAESVSQ